MTDDASDPQRRANELRADIERTRAQLGETVAELAYKADVKARVVDRAAAMREKSAVPIGAVVGAILAVLGYLWWRNH
ncbi:MAG TPA: DUF3618 domain-containing protein [Pseudonocardiaceae bacterium]|nr:DUF3618 domain-containing protein [Pseudonocardiaceae bacterium]